MDNTDNPSNPDAERIRGSPSNGQPSNPSSSRIQTHINRGVNRGIVNSLVDLREAVVRLGVELTALSNELGEDRSDFLGISGINPDLPNEIDREGLESTTNRIHDFRRDIHSQVAQLSETARFWLEQDPEETAFMPPEVPPGSPESTSAELGGPSFVPPRPPLIEAPRLLLGGSYHRSPLPGLAHLNSPLHAHTHQEHNRMPQLLSASDSSDDDEVDPSEYRTRFQAGESTRNPPEDPINDDYGMPGLMYISESSDDERAPTDDENSSDASGRDGEEVLEEGARPTQRELLLDHLNPPRLPYTRDPWVVPGSGMHQLLMQGRAPDDPSPPPVFGSEAGQPPRSLETREPHTDDAAWRSSRMQKLLSSLEVLDEPMLDRFCRVGGGGGDHNDQCMICWESLKVEPIGERSWTAIENTSSEENGHASTHPGNLTATPGTSTSLTMPSDGSGAAALPCLHVFHFKCLVPWFDKLATTCPVCRFDLDPHKLLLFPVSAPSSLQRLVNGRVLTREWTSGDPLFHQAVVAHQESRSRIGRSRQIVQSYTTSPMQSIGGDNDSWTSTEFSIVDSIPSLHSISAQQNDQDIAEDTPSEHSSGDNMPPLSEPLANGASDLAEPNPQTAEILQTITPLGPTSNGASNLPNPISINHDSSDEEHSTFPPTGVDNTGIRESTVLEEVDAEDPLHSTSDVSTDVDSMPSLIAVSEELDPLSSPANMGRNSQAAREESRGDSVDHNGERYRERSTAAQAVPTTGNPQEATFRDYAAETRNFLSEMQETLLNAYVRFSNIRTETATAVDVLQAQANRWASRTSDGDIASMPPPSATSGISTMIPVLIDRPPLWMSSQDAERREWVLPKGPVEGGVTNWINKREAEIRGDLETRPT